MKMENNVIIRNNFCSFSSHHLFTDFHPNPLPNNDNDSHNKTKSTIFFFAVKMRWNAKRSEARNLHTPFLVYSRNKIHSRTHRNIYTHTRVYTMHTYAGGVDIKYGVFKVKRKASIQLKQFFLRHTGGLQLYVRCCSHLYPSLFSALSLWTSVCTIVTKCTVCTVQMSSHLHIKFYQTKLTQKF